METARKHERAVARGARAAFRGPRGLTLGLAVLALSAGACVPDITTPDATPSYVERMDRARIACRGVPHEASPLEHEHVDVVAARPIAGFEGRPRVHRVRGARLLVRPRREMTAHELERWSACHIERHGLSADSERAPHDPLAVRGVTAEVRRGSGGYELWLTAPTRGAEIYRRARLVVD